MIWLFWVPVAGYFIFSDMMFGNNAHYMHGFVDFMMSGVLSFMLTMIASLPAIGIAFLVGSAFKARPVQVRSDKLTTIRNKDGVKGQFFLGSGILESVPYYFYYRELRGGGVSPGKIEADSGVEIFEENRKDATLLTFEWQFNSNWPYIFGFPTSAGGKAFEFHVPKGTIKTGFVM